MSSRNAPPNLDALSALHDIRREYGSASVVTALNNLSSRTSLGSVDTDPDVYAAIVAFMKRFTLPEVMQAFHFIMHDHGGPQTVRGHKTLCDDPSKWFGGTQIDDRDLSLINSSHASIPWVKFGNTFLLQLIYWNREHDEALRGLISEVGAEFIGFDAPPVRHPARDWEGMLITIAVTVNIGSEDDIRLLLGRPSKARVLAGPYETFRDGPSESRIEYTWDIMIIRDAWLNEDISGVPSVESRQFDILLMKFCARDYPWQVLAVKDSGPKEEAWHPF